MQETNHIIRTILCFFSGIVFVLVLLLILNNYSFGSIKEEFTAQDLAYGPSDIYFKNYDVNQLSDSAEDLEIKYGHEVFMNTPKYLGVTSGNDVFFVGNKLSCNNCHLLGGTKAYAAPLIGIIKRFPQFRGRENKIGSIEERINGCMERSMNGQKMSEDQKEMRALISYLDWLGRFSPEDGKIEGQGFVNLEIPDRPVDLKNGKRIFLTTCIECHGPDGQGRRYEGSDQMQYPPLWGPNSYNNGAGMTRVITAAQFIKANMPYGTTYLKPFLSDEDAYDVAGYVNHQPRPIKPHLEIDFPDLKRKPVSTPYPPFLDGFSLEQHQLGPFQPIMDYYEKEYGVKKTN
jgi:thiosulfate dehydrogenase